MHRKYLYMSRIFCTCKHFLINWILQFFSWIWKYDGKKYACLLKWITTHYKIPNYALKMEIKSNCNRYYTDAIKSVTIPAIVYYINTLDSQSCERDKGESTYLLIGDVSYKTINYNWANLQKFPIKWTFWRNSQTLPRFFI